MRLKIFSVTNYRSITKAHKIHLDNFTVLVGKNNEGKSNLLTALNVAMQILIEHGENYSVHPNFVRIDRSSPRWARRNMTRLYNWERDFPIHLQSKSSPSKSRFMLEFELNDNELSEFKAFTKIEGDKNLTIKIEIDKMNKISIRSVKIGSKYHTKFSRNIAGFISDKLSFNYIQAIRTDTTTINVLEDVINEELNKLNMNSEYKSAIDRIVELESEVLNELSTQLIEPLSLFLPNLKDVKIIQESPSYRRTRYRGYIDVMLNDGIETSISFKGDGIKSLVALAILNNRHNPNNASIIAIEEPEAHLHPGAIHSLINVILSISNNNQVIISTHNPLFVQRNNIKSNIIVNDSKATPAKNIIEIRDVLGVLPQDNLRSASHVLVVEGETDKIILSKILSIKSKSILSAIKNSNLVLKPLNGVGNLEHDIVDLKNSMCKFFILLDNDQAGKEAINKAKSKELITEEDFKLTICNGTPEAEIEDCINKNLYKELIQEKYNVDIDKPSFKNKKKWSIRMKDTFLNQGTPWDEKIESEIKSLIAESVYKEKKLDDILISQKSGFIDSLVSTLEKLLKIK
jgi:hypothetical protein